MKTELTQLGSRVEIPSSPDLAQIETIKISKNADEMEKASVRFTCPEFTSLCPMTHQPDYAYFIIDYVPRNLLVESKSLKLFLASFRSHGAFHEDVTVTIGIRLRNALHPNWIRVAGIWYPRGGIPLDIYWQSGEVPKNVYIPELKIPQFTGR